MAKTAKQKAHSYAKTLWKDAREKHIAGGGADPGEYPGTEDNIVAPTFAGGMVPSYTGSSMSPSSTSSSSSSSSSPLSGASSLPSSYVPLGSSAATAPQATSLQQMMEQALGAALANGGVSPANVIADFSDYVAKNTDKAGQEKVSAFLCAAFGAVGGRRNEWALANNALLKKLGEVGNSFVGTNGGNYKGWNMLGLCIYLGLYLIKTTNPFNDGGAFLSTYSSAQVQLIANQTAKFGTIDIRKWVPTGDKNRKELEDIMSDTQVQFQRTDQKELETFSIAAAQNFITATRGLKPRAPATRSAVISDYKAPTEEELAKMRKKKEKQRKA